MGTLDFKPETKYDFYIDKKRKQVWQVELDMLEIFKNICNKYDINYSLNGGTLLGAIRHKGFIPWDDDIDIMMLRNDYEKFLQVAEKELSEPYFLQYYKSEKGYYYGHAQIRNSNTTAFIKNDIFNNFNHGIFIDIFPLDNVPDNVKERKKFLKKISKFKKILSFYTVRQSTNLLKVLIKKVVFGLYWKVNNIDNKLKKFEEKCQKYNNISTEECGAIGFIQNGIKYKNEWFYNYIEVEFEYLNVKIIKDYDSFLTRQYGDYMRIPKNKNGSMHGNVFFDTETSYKEYNNNKSEIIDKLN